MGATYLRYLTSDSTQSGLQRERSFTWFAVTTRLVFATDLHGSEKCWRKFVNAAAFKKVDVLILGGDVTGKLIIPIGTLPDGKYKSFLSEQPTILANEEELAEHEKYIRYSGYYPYRANETEIEQLKNDKQKLETIIRQIDDRNLQRMASLG